MRTRIDDRPSCSTETMFFRDSGHLFNVPQLLGWRTSRQPGPQVTHGLSSRQPLSEIASGGTAQNRVILPIQRWDRTDRRSNVCFGTLLHDPSGFLQCLGPGRFTKARNKLPQYTGRLRYKSFGWWTAKSTVRAYEHGHANGYDDGHGHADSNCDADSNATTFEYTDRYAYRGPTHRHSDAITDGYAHSAHRHANRAPGNYGGYTTGAIKNVS